MKAKFERKPEFRLRDVVIEKAIHLPAEQFVQLLDKPFMHQSFITDNIRLMRMDNNGCYHCLLVTGEGRSDGLLIESEGYDYARYAAYVPEATALRYPSLAKMTHALAEAADFLIREGTAQTTDGSWDISFAKLEESSPIGQLIFTRTVKKYAP